MVAKAVLFAPGDRHESRAVGPPSQRLAMLPVGNRPLIRHALDELADAGVTDVSVISEPDVAEDVEQVLADWDGGSAATRHVTAGGEQSFIGALHEVADRVGDEPFLVHLGDSLRHGGLGDVVDATPAGHRDVLALVERRASDVLSVGSGFAALQSAGVYVFGPGVLELAEADERPCGWDVQIAAAMDQLVDSGGQVEVRSVSEWWRYAHRPDVLLQANRFYLSGLKSSATSASLERTDLQGPVVIDPTARLRSSTIRGPVIIGPGVDISDAYIGPYSSIGRDVTIENAEVEHSIILPGASIKHLGGRLEASVVGPGAKIFRDFRLPRALRLNVGEGAEVALT